VSLEKSQQFFKILKVAERFGALALSVTDNRPWSAILLSQLKICAVSKCIQYTTVRLYCHSNTNKHSNNTNSSMRRRLPFCPQTCRFACQYVV